MKHQKIYCVKTEQHYCIHVTELHILTVISLKLLNLSVSPRADNCITRRINPIGGHFSVLGSRLELQ